MISLFQNELNLHKRSRSRGSSSQLGLKLRTAAASVCRFFGCGLAFPVLALMSILRENPSLCKEPTMKLPSTPVGSSSPIHPDSDRYIRCKPPYRNGPDRHLRIYFLEQIRFLADKPNAISLHMPTLKKANRAFPIREKQASMMTGNIT